MLAADQVEELITVLSSWDRATLINRFIAFRSNFPVDCSTDFLGTLDVDRLRHIFLALCLQNQRLPELANSPLPLAA
jgi:hypothetical protein